MYGLEWRTVYAYTVRHSRPYAIHVVFDKRYVAMDTRGLVEKVVGVWGTDK